MDTREISETFHPFQERMIDITSAICNPENKSGRFIELVYSDYGFKTWLWKLHNIYKRTDMGNYLFGYIPLPADKIELARCLGEIAYNEGLSLASIADAYHDRKDFDAGRE